MDSGKRPPLDEQKSLWLATIAAEGVTTLAGEATGLSLVDAGLAGAGANSFVSMLAVIHPGDPQQVDSKDITAFNNGTGEVTVASAFKGGQVAAGVPYKIVTFRFVPAEVAALTTMLESNQYYDKIFYDEDTGIAGTAWPIGTPQVPSDVIADIITMCTARNIYTIQVHGALILGATMQHYSFVGYEHEDIADILDLSDEDVDGSHISGLIVTGGQGGANFLTLVRCIANAVTLFNGRMNQCSFWSSTCSFKDGGYIDLVDCNSIYGAVTITVQAPTRASIKNWRGNLILTAQDGGTCLVRGFKGTLEIDAMTLGTLNVYANGADITINGDCSGGIINIYGNARVTDNSGATVVNDYTKETQLDDIETKIDTIDPIVDNVLLDTQVRTIQSGVKAINATTKYLHIDSGTNGAEILSIVIEGVIGHDWTLDVYVPAADAEAATQAKSKRDTIAYLAADSEGGLLAPFAIPFDAYLDFTDDGANGQIDQVTITYRSRGALTLTWEA